jgi:peptidoglycan-associated lipoprotein
MIAGWLRAHPEVEVGLDGRADLAGSDDWSPGLSAQRVAAVQTALIAAGVEPVRIHVGALGERTLLCTDAEESCWKRNRRVEVLLRRPS